MPPASGSKAFSRRNGIISSKPREALPDNSKFIYAGGRPPVSTSGTRRAVQNAQPNIEVKFDPELGHLFPFIQTEFAVDVLREVLAGPKL